MKCYSVFINNVWQLYNTVICRNSEFRLLVGHWFIGSSGAVLSRTPGWKWQSLCAACRSQKVVLRRLRDAVGALLGAVLRAANPGDAGASRGVGWAARAGAAAPRSAAAPCVRRRAAILGPKARHPQEGRRPEARQGAAASLVERFFFEPSSDFSAKSSIFIQGSFSAVSTPNFPRKYSFESIFQDLQDICMLFAPLELQYLSILQN